MNALNLLRHEDPPAHRRTGVIGKPVVLPVAAALLLVGTCVVAAMDQRGTARRVAALELALADAWSAVPEDEPQADAHAQAVLAHRARLAAVGRVRNPMPPADALAVLSDVLPDGIRLSAFSMSLDASMSRTTDPRAGGDPGAHPGVPRVTLRVAGWAEDEVLVTEALERINRAGHLGEAHTAQSYPETAFPGGWQAFRIESRLDCRYVALAEAETGVTP